MEEHVKKYGDIYFRFNGILFDSSITSKESLEMLNDYGDIRDDDVVVWIYPKSGTHLMMDVASKVMFDGDLDKYAAQSGELWFEESPPEYMKPHNPASKFTQSLQDLSDAKSPRIIASHVHFDLFPKKIQQGAAKIIYLSRNPKDICVSFYEMFQKLCELNGRDGIQWSNFPESFLDGNSIIFGSWAEHVKNFYAVKEKKNLLWVKYEDLVADLPCQVKRISDFLGRQLNDKIINTIAESCKFEAVKKQFPNSLFLRKGRVGGWKESFTVAQSERFDEKLRQILGDSSDEILS